MRWSIVLLGLAIAAPAGAQQYETRLTAVAYDAAMRANVQGDGDVTADLDGNRLTVKGTFNGLASAATQARLYSGPGIGVPGPAILDLALAGQTDGSIQGSFSLTAAQLAAFKRGHVYVQINSRNAPDGNLWGWLLPDHPFPGADVPEEGDGFVPQLDVPGNWTEK
jgi:hypothetical protein